ncbi:MAG: ribosome maturation factor RimP [Dethiobacteria bacterium]
MRKDNLVAEIEKAIDPIIYTHQVELVDIEWARKGSRWNLCIYLDKTGGITIDDCEAVHYEISDLLDRIDLIQHSYVLEISSPGLNRPLKKKENFDRFRENYVKITTDVPIEGQKKFKGLLQGLRDDHILLENKEGQIKIIPFDTVLKANLWYKPDFKKYERRSKKR